MFSVCYSKWAGGMYTTPTLAGSRSAGLVSQTWASILSTGEKGYLENTKAILDCSAKISAGISAIKGLKVLGGDEGHTMIVCFTSSDPTMSIYTGTCVFTQMLSVS